MLAVEQINAAGGIRFDPAPGDARPLVLVACDASRDAVRAANHLVQELGIRALLGPDDSQDSQLIATKVAIPNDALVIHPIASTGSLPDLLDDDLSWLMVPTDVQRAPWFAHQLGALEKLVREQRPDSDPKLGIVVRDDAQGQSLRAALSGSTLDGLPIADSENLGSRVRIDAYATDRPEALEKLVDAYLGFAPDIVVLLGLTEIVTRFLTPLEERWAAAHPNRRPPEYFVTDTLKIPELVELAARRDELRSRIRGVGAGPEPAAEGVHAAFTAAYRRRFSSELTAISGLASTYDATNALAFAIAAEREIPTSGRSLASALRRISAGSPAFGLQSDQLSLALDAAAAGTPLGLIGALAPLRWDERGAPSTGALELWCLNRTSGRTNFASSGFRVAAADRPGMEFGACARDGVQTSPAPPTVPGPDAEDPEPSPDTTPKEPDTSSAPSDAGVTDAAPPDPGPPPADPGVPCGENECDVLANEYCCVTTLRGVTTDPLPEDFRCTASDGACAVALHCTSDSDCGGGTVCCGTTSSTECMPEGECSARAGTRLACESSRQCAEGQTCCAQLMAGITGYANIACASTCSVAAGGLVLCESDQDCVDARALGTCRPSRIVPNLKVCGLF